MMASAGIKSDIAKFDAISSRTRKMIQNARRNSEGGSLRTVVSSPTLPLRGLVGVAAGERKKEEMKLLECQSDPQDSEATTSPSTHVDSDRQENSSQSSQTSLTKSQTSHTSLTRSTDSSPNLSRNEAKDNRCLNGLKAKSVNRSPQKPITTDPKAKNMRNRSSSLVILPPAPKRSLAAQKMAEEPPKLETDGNSNEETEQQGKDELEIAAAPTRPNNVPELAASDSLTSSTDVRTID